MLLPVNHVRLGQGRADRVACQPGGVSTPSRSRTSPTYSSTSRYVCDRTALRDLLGSTHPSVRVYSSTAFVLVDRGTPADVDIDTGSLTFVWSPGNRI
jgi:hypothetical protein